MADRLAVTARSGARTGPHGDSIEPAGFGIRHLITACEQITGWTRFAGTKAALVLTAGGVFASFLVPAISHLTQGTRDAAALAASALGVAWADFVALSCTEAFRCILPRALNAVHTAVGAARTSIPQRSPPSTRWTGTSNTSATSTAGRPRASATRC